MTAPDSPAIDIVPDASNRMRLLQKYILGELIRVFLFVLSVLTVLLVFVGAFGQVSENGLGPAEILQILPFLVPSLLPFTIPATMLLTVTIVYGRIAADHEVTAAKAAGISAMSLLWPSFILSAVLGVISLFLTDQVIPWAMSNIERRVAQMMEQILLDVLRAHGRYVHQNPDLRITVLNVEGNKLIKPVFQFTPKDGQPITTLAEEASLRIDLEKRLVLVTLVNSRVEAANRQNVRISHPREFRFPIPKEPQHFKARQCTIHELRTSVEGLTGKLEERHRERDLETAFALGSGDFERLESYDLLQYEVDQINNKEQIAYSQTEIHSRFALSASCFFFALLGGPFAVLQARRQVLTCFFICFLPILVGYYPVILLMMNLSKSTLINPAWGMWTGNALILPIAWSTLRRVLLH